MRKNTVKFCELSTFWASLALMQCFAVDGYAQSVVSVADGPWNNTATWSPAIIPDASNSTSITVDHDITLPAGYSVSVDATTVNASLVVSGTLTIDPAASSFVVNGTLSGQNGSLISGTNGVNVVFNSGSTYDHAFTTTQGIVPLALWDANSTIKVTGYTSGKNFSAAGNWSQDFGHFIYDCTAQAGPVNFNGLVVSAAGDLTFSSTGANQVYLGSSHNYVLAVAGALKITNMARVVFATTGSPTLTVGTDFDFTSTNSGGSLTSTDGTTTFNIGRDFLMNASGGLFRVGYIVSVGGATFNIGRHFNLTAGTITESSVDPGFGTFNFTNGTSHSFTNSGSILNRINYVVGINDVLTMVGESRMIGGLNSTLDLAGTLVLNSVDANGAIQNGNGASGNGNVWVQNRTYQAGAIVSYAGAAPQFIGNGHPTGATVETHIDNSSGVSLISTSVTSMGNLLVNSGTFTISNNSIAAQSVTTNGGSINFTTTTTSRTFTINGSLQLTNGNITVSSGTSTADLVINGDILAGAGSISFAGANNRITVGGTGAFTSDFPLAGTSSIRTINITRGGGGTLSIMQDVNAVDVTINSGGLDINAAKTLTISNNLNIGAGGTLFFEGSTLNLQKFFNNTLSGGFLSSDGLSTLNITSTGVLGTLAFSGSGNTLGTLTINRPTTGTLVTLNSTLTISNTFNLTDGILDNISGLQMGVSSTINRTPNASFTVTSAAPGGGPYNITYLGGVSLLTGREAAGSVNDVDVNLSGNTSVLVGMTVQGTLSLNSGTFVNGGGLLTMASGGLIDRNSAASYNGPAPSGGPYDVRYTGASMNTRPEVQGSLNDFTSDCSGTVTVNLLMTVPGVVTINSGTLAIQSNTLTMGNLASFVRYSGSSVTGVSPAGGPYNVTYEGTSLTTQFEALGNVNDITANLTGTATQGASLDIAGTLHIADGTWTSNANALDVGAVINDGTLNAPSTALTLTGDFEDNGTFGHSDGTVVFNGTSSLTGTSNSVFKNIQLNGSATLTFPALVYVAGNIVFASGGTFNHGSGTVELTESATQDLDAQGKRFYAITINKSGGSVSLSSSLNLANVLLITSATVLNTGGFLTVLSQPDGPGSSTDNDGSIGPITGGGSVVGNVIVQRFMIAKGLGNRYISPAVTGVGFAELTDDMNIFSGYLRFYNEALRGAIGIGYTNVTSATVPLQVGRGYLVYVDNNVDIQLDVTGPISAGPLGLPVTYTNAPNPDPNADGWNLAGNPYPSPIVWNNDPAAWTRSNVDPVITVYDISGSASYTYNYTNGSGTLPNGIIATGQSFWVHLSAAGSLNIDEPAKVSGTGGSFFRVKNEAPEQLIVSLTNGTFTDNSVLVRDKNATAGFDASYDGYKLKNENISIYFLDAEGRHLVMNAVDEINEDFVLPLEVQVDKPGLYTIRISGLEAFPHHKDLYFIDQVEGTATSVSELGEYSLAVPEATTLSDRFYLSAKALPLPEKKEQVLAYPNPTRDYIYLNESLDTATDFAIHDATGNQVGTGVWKKGGQIDLSGHSKGMYVLKVRTAKGIFVTKVFKRD